MYLQSQASVPSSALAHVSRRSSARVLPGFLRSVSGLALVRRSGSRPSSRTVESCVKTPQTYPEPYVLIDEPLPRTTRISTDNQRPSHPGMRNEPLLLTSSRAGSRGASLTQHVPLEAGHLLVSRRSMSLNVRFSDSKFGFMDCAGWTVDPPPEVNITDTYNYSHPYTNTYTCT